MQNNYSIASLSFEGCNMESDSYALHGLLEGSESLTALDLSDNIIFEMTGNKIDKKNIEDTIKEIIKNEQSRELN